MGNIITSLFTLVFGVFFFIMSYHTEKANPLFSDGKDHSMNWPRMLLGMLIIFGLVLLTQSIIKVRKERQDQSFKSNQNNAEQEGTLEVYPKRFYLVLLATFLYIILIQYIGFTLATPICLFFLALIAGMKQIPLLILVPIISSAILVIIFPILLHVPMPRGVSIFRDFSLIFY